MARRFKVRDYKAGLVFNGAAYVQLPALSTSSGISVSAWIKTPTPVPSSAMDILGRSAGASDLFEVTSTGQIRFNINTSGGVNNNLSATNVLPKNKFVHVTATYNISTGVSRIYLNSVLISSLTAGSGTFTNNANTWMLGALTSATRLWVGNLLEVGVWDAELTSTEIANLYYDGVIPRESALEAFYLCDEGAGTTLNDISGNLQNGTITTATFNADVPFVARKNVNSNLVKNGSIDYIPPFTAAGTTSARWIDGTAGGSTTNDIFGWAQVVDTASASAQFDSTNSKVGKYSLRVDTLDASGRARVCQGGGSGGTAGSIAIATLKKYGIPVKPSTSYTFGAWVKYTNVLTGNCNFQIDEMDGTGTRVASSNNAFGSGTSDWVYKTLTFTTSATTQFIVLALGFNSVGEVKTAWFDDVSLYPTTPVTRTTNTRNRLGVRNGLYSMLFNGSSTELTRSAINNTGTKWATEFWFKLNTVAVRSNFVYRGNGDGNYPRVYTSGTGTAARVAIQYAMQGQVSQSFSATTPIVPYKWYHVVATIDNDIGVTALYVNGVLEASQTPNGGIGTVVNSGVSGLAIGHDGNIPLWMNGKMALFRLWKGMSLSAEDAQDLYLSGTVPVTKPPTVEYLFNEGSGTTATDTSGNGLDSTIANGTFVNDRPFSARTNV